MTLLGQSKVIGELLAGIIIGPSILGLWLPQASIYVHDANSMLIVQALGELGLIILIFEVPWHISDINSLSQRRGPGFWISFSGIAVSFIIGCALGVYSKDAIAPDQPCLTYVGFCGIAISATALPVLLRIINENNHIESNAGKMALSAAIYTDIFVWLFLALILAAQLGDLQRPLQSILKVAGLAAYIFFALAIVRPAIKNSKLFFTLSSQKKSMIAIAFCCISAQITERLGFHLAIGALIAANIFLEIPQMRKYWNLWIGRSARLFLVPIFFASSTMNISLNSILQREILWWLLIFFLASGMAKVTGSFIGAKLAGVDTKGSLQIGVLMNVKGLAEIIVLNVGLSSGMLSESSYGVLLTLSILSMIVANPLIYLINSIHSKVAQGRRKT